MPKQTGDLVPRRASEGRLLSPGPHQVQIDEMRLETKKENTNLNHDRFVIVYRDKQGVSITDWISLSTESIFRFQFFLRAIGERYWDEEKQPFPMKHYRSLDPSEFIGKELGIDVATDVNQKGKEIVKVGASAMWPLAEFATKFPEMADEDEV